MTAKKCTKKRDARAELLLYLSKPIAFSKSSLPTPSSLLRLPNVTRDRGRSANRTADQRVPRNDSRNNYGMYFGSSSLLDSNVANTEL